MVDFGDSRGKQNENFFRWAYTAITRAKSRLMVISPPRFTVMSDMKWGCEPAPVQIETPSRPDNPGTADTANSSTNDPDWKHFEFSPQQQPLFDYHCAMREAWAVAGIDIQRLEHLQYCERYQISRGQEQACIQYHYKGNFTKPKVSPCFSGLAATDLLIEAQALMSGALLNPRGPSKDSSTSPFIQEMIDRLNNALAPTDIQLASVLEKPYRLRVGFSQNGQSAVLDFLFNGTPKWTRVEEVGGAGTSRGLLAKIQGLLNTEASP